MNGSFPQLVTNIQALLNQIIQTGPVGFAGCANAIGVNITQALGQLAGGLAGLV